jgi:hypothetical protein
VIDASNSRETHLDGEDGLWLKAGEVAFVLNGGKVITHGDWASGIVTESGAVLTVEG